MAASPQNPEFHRRGRAFALHIRAAAAPNSYRTVAGSGFVPISALRSSTGTTQAKESAMGRMLLLQTVLGHLALLEQKYPKKAASPVARRAKRYIARMRRQG
jgi:hypothetical protein